MLESLSVYHKDKFYVRNLMSDKVIGGPFDSFSEAVDLMNKHNQVFKFHVIYRGTKLIYSPLK